MIYFLILALYCIGLWRISVPLTGDQKTYISIALEMKSKSSFLIPYLFDRPNFLKPPFQYWMTLVGWEVFGFSLFGTLIPSVIALVGSAFFVKRLSGEKSILSAIVFSSTVATMTYGTTAQMEIWIVLFYLIGWYLYLKEKTFAGFGVVGMLAWIKGPLYPVLFVVSLVFKAFLEKSGTLILKRKFLLPLLLGVVIGLLWYAAAAFYEYNLLRDVFLSRENFGKISTPQGTPFGLWREFLITLFPINLLILASVFDPLFKLRWQKNKSFYLAYSLIPGLFFTFFPYRVNTYLYLLTPLVSWFSVLKPNPPKAIQVFIQFSSSLISVVAIFLIFRLSVGGWLSIYLGCALSLTFLAWTYSHYKFEGIWIGVSSLILVNLFRLGATEVGEWDLKTLKKTQSSEFAYLIEPNQEDIWHELGLISTAIGHPIKRVKSEVEEKVFLESGGTLILSDEQNPLPNFPVNTHCNPWIRLKRRVKFPILKLLTTGLSIESPELHRIFKLCQIK